MSPNANYLAGRAFEYERAAYYRSLGHEVMRTAGSHGKYDLITISTSGHVQFVQCKRCSTLTESDNLLRGFVKSPPLTACKATQRMDVKVKGTTKVESVWI